MKELNDLRDLLCHEVQVMYGAEKLMLAGLMRMIKKTNNLELKAAFQQHLAETEGHIERLMSIAEMLDIDPNGDANPAMTGLIAEGEKVMHKDSNPETLDATLIAGAQKIEHYEIAGYGAAVCFAEQLGLVEIAEMLRLTLNEEKATDLKLTQLAVSKINTQKVNVESRQHSS